MARFFQQIILLTRKNLRIRSSHWCLTFCELFIPLFITTCIGIIVSFSTRVHNGRQPTSTYSSTTSSTIDDDTSGEKYTCSNTYWSSRYSEYQCESRHDNINGDGEMEQIRQLNIQYIISDKIKDPNQQTLIEEVMTNVLKAESGENNITTTTSNWTKSKMSERALEICILQQHEECQGIIAVIVITKIQDAVKSEKKLEMEYKVRLTNHDNYIDAFYTDRLFTDYSYYYFRTIADNTEAMYMGYEYKDEDWKGFVYIQAFLDRGIMEYIRTKYGSRKSKEIDLSLVSMPYIQPISNESTEVSRFISLLYSLLASLSIFNLMRVNGEKSSGFKELLRMHGVTTRTQWMGWLFSNFILYAHWTFLLTLLLRVPIGGGPNLLPILGINSLLYWLLLLLFVMSMAAFSCLVSVFFEKVWTAASIGLVVWIMLTVFMMVASTAFSSLRKWTAMGLMLIPTVAFDFAFRFLLYGGGTFRTVATEVIENVHLTTLHCLFMLLLDSCIFITLTVYLDNILPSKYGVRKPPFYFLRDFRKFVEKVRKSGGTTEVMFDDEEQNDTSVEMTSIISRENEQGLPFLPFQSDPEHVEAAVVIHNLRKVFKRNKKRAVDGLNAKMFSGEIYALLGFNGAGKTTTIDVLTGLTSPTRGEARIFDLDIVKDMEEIRKHIGLCPQHNLLFNEMTVLEQLSFFAELKGVVQPKAKAEELLKWLGMSDKLHYQPEELSGGQKRRVHLAIALIGDTKLAFLDEPTSGLDPETRRGVWDILLKLRGKMTVILTTHDMEEADVLGDRIGIMSEGKMMCSGTPSYLKKYYGVGYNLKMSGAPECDPVKVYTIARNHVPTAKLNPISGQSVVGSFNSISISLPTADLDLLKVSDLMDELRNKKGELGVENIGLSLSTMDEVFQKVGEAERTVAVNVPTAANRRANNTLSSSRYVGSRLRWYRFTSLFSKRMIYFTSAPYTLLFLILFFAIILWLSLTSLSFAINSSTESDPPRVVSSSSLPSYQSPNILIHDDYQYDHSDNFSYAISYLYQLHQVRPSHLRNYNVYPSLNIREFSHSITFEEIMDFLKKSSIDDLHEYRHKMLLGASFNTSENIKDVIGFYSIYALHSAPLSLNLISQTLIKKMFGIDSKIGVINHPFKRANKYDHISPEYLKQGNQKLFDMVEFGGVMILVVITTLLTATAALLPTEERLNKGKQLQLMTGTTPLVYWTSMFAWDFFFFSMVNVVILFVYILADFHSGNWIFTNNGAGAIIFLILECHAFAALWFCYLISWAPCISSASDGFLIVNKLALIVGVIWNVIRNFIVNAGISESDMILAKIIYYFSYFTGYVTWVVPMYSLFPSMYKLAAMSMQNSICHWFPEDVLHMSCAELEGKGQNKLDMFLQSCCINCKENCFEPRSYFWASPDPLFHKDGNHSMIFDILVMLLSGFICAVGLFSLEYIWPQMKAQVQIEKLSATQSEDARLPTDTPFDEDVINEGIRVEELCKDDNAIETANHALVVHNLHLQFDTLKAVKGLTFGVYRGECFGLLGVNGAGKTSTFRMITGDILPTAGNMYSGGLNFYNQRSAYLSSLGYCPQFDGIIGSLTGLQMVKLYGALRGIPPDKLREDAMVWLDKFGLLRSANKKCSNYSGGMKRRLSAAMALIGNPSLLLMDEPTTGVDPAFRRQFWNVIREIREGGQSVLLTSHTMDECEALCTRLGIMVAGQFKCLGDIQHLKSKFGKGYILTIKLKRVPEEEEQENEEKVKQLQDHITGEIGLNFLQTQQKTLLQYQIVNRTVWYSDIFRLMERIRSFPEISQVIEEYSVTETSLEDIFISFATRRQ